MERPGYPALYLFIVALLLQGNGTSQFKEDSHDGLTRTQRGERVAPGFCPDGWYTFGEMCYLIGTSRYSRERAERECSRMSSYLVTIHSQEEQEFLNMLLLEIQGESWIGLSRSRFTTNVFSWNDYSPLDYTNWAEGEPNNYEGREENCVIMEYIVFETGQWNDIPCGQNRYYICQKPKDPTLTKPGQDPAMCPWKYGWVKMSDSCYTIFHRTESFSSWSRAQSLCKSYGGNLAYVKNPAVNKLLETNTKGLEGPFWTGIKSTNKHKYTWLGKNHPLMYSNWQTDEPKEIPDEQNCVAMDADGKWIIRDCDENHAFMCQIGPELPEPPTLGSSENMTCSYTSEKWHDIGGKYCYIIELTVKFKWREALCRCKEEGGSLASLHSSEETNVLLHYIKHHDMPLQPVFIGLVRDEKGTFGWSDGSAYDYTNWNSGEPNDLSEQCTAMHTTNGKWNDISCHVVYGHVCSTLKVPLRDKSTSKPEKPVSKTETAKLTGDTGEGTQLSAGSIAVIAVTCLLVVAAVLVVSAYCFGNTLKTKLLERSPYSGIE